MSEKLVNNTASAGIFCLCHVSNREIKAVLNNTLAVFHIVFNLHFH